MKSKIMLIIAACMFIVFATFVLRDSMMAYQSPVFKEPPFYGKVAVNYKDADNNNSSFNTGSSGRWLPLKGRFPRMDVKYFYRNGSNNTGTLLGTVSSFGNNGCSNVVNSSRPFKKQDIDPNTGIYKIVPFVTNGVYEFVSQRSYGCAVYYSNAAVSYISFENTNAVMQINVRAYNNTNGYYYSYCN